MDMATRTGFLFFGSVGPVFSLFIYQVASNVPIKIEYFQARMYITVLALVLVVSMVKNMFKLLILPEKGIAIPLYILAVTSCVGIPFAFAAIYSVFQRTGECIKNYIGGFDDIYFSYTTLTTLGYGDLSPISYCRVFTALESISGYFALGVLVSVGVAIFQDQNRLARDERQELLEQSMDQLFKEHWEEIRRDRDGPDPNDSH